MPINYSRKVTGRKRTADANYHLGYVLCFVAGAVNAGGFLAVQQYTSHMTGIISSMADDLVLGSYDLVLSGLGAVISFLMGAMCSAIMVNFSRRRRMNSEFALPLLLEASSLLCFGILGSSLEKIDGLFVPLTVMLLCFIMGLQNALITKISKAEIRTTHLTGIVTDIGIELGKLFYWNSRRFQHHPKIDANRERLKLLMLLVFFFFVGGVSGAVGFKHIGYIATLPLALILILLASVPALDDMVVLIRKIRRK